MNAAVPRLHAVTDERVARRTDLERVAAALARGAPDLALHARGHTLTGLEHHELAIRLRPSPAVAVRLFVNDRLDVALAAGADGVHLGGGSLSVADARRLNPAWIVGRSVHSLPEARAARDEGADYLLAGPVFATATHPGAAPLGLDVLAAIAGLDVPVIAIGGITAAEAGAVREAGAWGVAAIRALWDAPDPEATARVLRAALE